MRNDRDWSGLGYIDIIKRAFDVTNRNMLALLVQFGLWVVIGGGFVLLFLMLIVMAAGSLGGLDMSTISPDIIWQLVKSSLTLVFTAVLLLLVGMLISFVLAAFVNAGILGCIIDTARGESDGFTASSFFASARRSALHLLWFYILWGMIALCVFGALALVGIIGFVAVLIPMRDAGSNVGAFVIGVPLLVVLIIGFIVALFLSYAGGMVSSIALVGERTGASSALGAMYRFTKKNFWDVLLFTLVMILISIAGSIVSEVVTLPVSLSTRLGGSTPVMVLVFVMVVMMFFQMYVALLGQACFAVFYLDRTAPPVPPVPGPGPQGPAEDAEDVMDAEVLDVEPLDEDTGRSRTEGDIFEWEPEPLGPPATPGQTGRRPGSD